MEGKEFVTRLLNVEKYKKIYEENAYFRRQINNLKNKARIHTQDLIECMVYLSNELVEKDFDMIDHAEQSYLMEDIL
mgnify:FL=1